MRKKFLVFVAVLLLAIILGCLAACNKPLEIGKLNIDSEDLMKGAKIVDIIMERPITDAEIREKELKNASNMLADNDKYWKPSVINNYACVEIELAGEKTFNTALISEDGTEVRYFRLQAFVDGKWKNLYSSEKIGEQRIISFDKVTSSRVRFSIEKFTGESKTAKIHYFKLYCLEADSTKELNVTAYQRIDVVKPSEVLANGDEYAKTYARYYDVYNTIIVFDAVNWDEQGNLVFANEGVDGLSGKEYFEREINALKQLVAMRTNPHKVKIIVTALADGAGGSHGGVNVLMSANHSKIAAKMAEVFIKDYDLDGVDIDWEYPQNKDDWACYDIFMKELKQKMHEIKPDAIISAALSAWAIGMSKETMDLIDQIQYMAYDDLDLHGDQSTIYNAQMGIANFVRNGADKSKINIGIPSYGRPTGGGPYWPEWKNNDQANYFDSRYSGIVCGDNMYRESSFCSPALAGDKTALAIFSGCGGVMVFRLNCDKLMNDPNAVACGIENTLSRYFSDWGR